MRALCLTPFTHPSLAILHSGLTDPWPRCVEVKVGCTLDRLPLNHWATQSQQASALTSTANAESPMSLTCVFGDIRADKGRRCKLDILHSDRKSFGSRQNRMEQFCCAGWASRSRERLRSREDSSPEVHLGSTAVAASRGQRRPPMPPCLLMAPLIGSGPKASAL